MNLITEKIRCIQHEYKNLLDELLRNSDNGLTSANLDEICLFWFRHIKTIDIFMKNNIRDKNTYVFTGSTFMDFNDGQHLPYLLLGDFHIFDDPLSRYSNTCNSMDKNSFSIELLEQITLTAKDNLNILNNCNEYIIILPCRFLRMDENTEILYNISHNIFTNLFKDVIDIEDYFEKINTVQDICDSLTSTGKAIIFFPDHIKSDVSFSEKLEGLLGNLPDYLNDYQKPSVRFYTAILGFIAQSVDIITSCVDFGCIPFIRNLELLHYINIIFDSISQPLNVSESFGTKINQAHFIYRNFDFQFFSEIEFSTFIATRNRFNFYEKLNTKSEEICNELVGLCLHELDTITEEILLEFKKEFDRVDQD